MSLYENLRQLITVIDELRDVGLQKYISLPRIVAIGTQSSGKSSLVESIVGRDFLPRGGGVVTRRPLELRLVHLNSQEYQKDQAWATFDKLSDKKYTDFNEVRKEVERQTDLVAGSNKGIVNDPIVLTVYASDCPDLTLVDLPGITRVPVKGSDQTEDVEKLTREMTLHYISDPRTIILAVLPANQDVTVSDALQLARHVDPTGVRSIGVVTKIDIMDQGTDASKLLRGEDIPLKHGYVGVKMRSQQDINDNKPINLALEDEKAWFDNHRVYGKLPPGLVGTTVLIEKLTQILFRSMRRFLPEIKREINEKGRSVQDRLSELGEGVPLEFVQKTHLMWTLVTDYCDLFKNTIRGKYDRKLSKYTLNIHGGVVSGSGGARVRSIMSDFLGEHLDVNITAAMTDEDIDSAIRLHEGDSLPGFPSPDTFEFLALPHLQKLNSPSIECVHNVASSLDLLAQRIAHAVFRRFPKMAEATLALTQTIIQREKDATRLIVEQQVAAITGYLFTNDLQYLCEHGSMEPMYPSQVKQKELQSIEESRDPTMTEKAMKNVQDTSGAMMNSAKNLMQGRQSHIRSQRYSTPYVAEIRKRLDAYFSITIRNIRDTVPKAVGYYLVRAVTEKIQFELLNTLNNKDQLEALLGEPAHIAEERKTLAAQLAVLQKATGVLTRDPTLAAIALEAEDEEINKPSAPQNLAARKSNNGSSASKPTSSSDQSRQSSSATAAAPSSQATSASTSQQKPRIGGDLFKPASAPQEPFNSSAVKSTGGPLAGAAPLGNKKASLFAD